MLTCCLSPGEVETGGSPEPADQTAWQVVSPGFNARPESKKQKEAKKRWREIRTFSVDLWPPYQLASLYTHLHMHACAVTLARMRDHTYTHARSHAQSTHACAITHAHACSLTHARTQDHPCTHAQSHMHMAIISTFIFVHT